MTVFRLVDALIPPRLVQLLTLALSPLGYEVDSDTGRLRRWETRSMLSLLVRLSCVGELELELEVEVAVGMGGNGPLVSMYVREACTMGEVFNAPCKSYWLVMGTGIETGTGMLDTSDVCIVATNGECGRTGGRSTGVDEAGA